MLKRTTQLKADPAKTRAWRQRSKPLNRQSAIKASARLSKSGKPNASNGRVLASQGLQSAKRRGISSKPPKRIGTGRRMKAWSTVWRWLKPRLESAGRTRCEFDFLVHNCGGPLDPAHSKKRAHMKGDDIYAVALACRTIHNYLDGVHVYPPLARRMNHEEMERAVMTAINNHGGLILP